jgi:putative ABC transport system permease protein
MLAVATGVAVGTILPLLLGPALGLDEFTGGTPFTVVADPHVTGPAALLAIAVAAAGVLAQAATNRRHHLGGVLRVA